MKEIVRKWDQLIYPTVDELLECFWSLSCHDMATFFNDLNLKPELPFQLQYVTDSPNLNSNGRSAMRMIGQYAECATNGGQRLQKAESVIEALNKIKVLWGVEMEKGKPLGVIPVDSYEPLRIALDEWEKK